MVSSSVTPTLPAVNSGWQWQTWQGLPYLTCSLLSDWQHGFFTQNFWPSTPAELVDVLQPGAEFYRLKQVHGNQILSASEIVITQGADGETIFPPADGALTAKDNQAVWVATADCTPVLIADQKTGKVAAVHAGWRGTAQRIVPQAIKRLLEAGSNLDNLLFAMGPAINGKVYQVSEQVAIEVGKSILSPSLGNDSQVLLEALKNLPDSPILDDLQPGRVRLDVRRVNELQLEQLGIETQKIAIASLCTYQQPDYFFSYRRRKQKKVQWSGIVSKTMS